MRKIRFQNYYYYHIFNRGVDGRIIFMNENDYFNFLLRLSSLNTNLSFEERKGQKKELSSFSMDSFEFVEIVTYCLMPNHYHLLLRQKVDNGVSHFMHKIGTGYTNGLNKKYKRSGSLFQGSFKAVEIKTDAQLQYVSAYINGNPEIHGIKKAEEWVYSSCRDYLGKRNGVLAKKDIILKDFEDNNDYKKYMDEVIKNSKEIKDIKKDIKDNMEKYLME